VVCGRASVSFERWVGKLEHVKTPVLCAQQGIAAAVQAGAYTRPLFSST
jgi:hypothetical protein